MSERLPWQRFYRSAEGAGYLLELPGVKDRTDFRTKLTKYTGRDPKTNLIRPVYIRGKGKSIGADFFGKWDIQDDPDRLSEEREIKEMMRDACAGETNIALSFAHYQSEYTGLEQAIDIGYTSGFLQFDLPLRSYRDDRLVAAFLTKAREET